MVKSSETQKIAHMFSVGDSLICILLQRNVHFCLPGYTYLVDNSNAVQLHHSGKQFHQSMTHCRIQTAKKVKQVHKQGARCSIIFAVV